MKKVKKIKVDEIKNIMLIEETEDLITVFTTNKLVDDFGKEYELIKDDEEFFKIDKIFNMNIYISKTRLLETLLTKEIKAIEGNEIYEHGYPESRLIPSNFYEECQSSFVENVKEKFSEETEEILLGML